MYYLVYRKLRDQINYIYLHRCNDETLILNNVSTDRIVVRYDDIHSFLQSHKQISFGASLIIDEKDISEELLDFMTFKMKELIFDCEMTVAINTDHMILKSHVLDFIEKMRYRDFFPDHFEVMFDDGSFFIIGDGNPLN